MGSKKLFLLSMMLFVLLVFGFVVSIEASLATWSRTYGGESMEVAHCLVVTSDGGYALTGYTWSFGAGIADFWLVKTDALGNEEWNKTYGGPGYEEAYCLVETSDGGYALLGDALLVKTDAYGNMEWNKTYGLFTRALVETSGGGFALAGHKNDDFWLIKTDAYGNMEWNKTYGRGRSDRAYALVETSDGGYALAGETISNGYGDRPYWESWLVKTDASGVMEWNQTCIRGGASAVVQTSDGGYALTGYIGTLNPLIGIEYYCWLVKTDAYGNMLWNWTYGDGSALSLVETFDGGYALAGSAGLIRIGAHGNMIWNQTYKGGTVYALAETSDGGYALAGNTGSIVSGKTDFWLAKTDELGFIPEFHPPYIRVGSPQNKTYTTDRVSLNFTVNEETSWMGYSLDGQKNVTITENTSPLTGLTDGSHNITVYATDTDGNTVTSETTYFTIKATPTKWIATIAIATVATAAAVVIIHYTRTKKNRTKNDNIIGA